MHIGFLSPEYITSKSTGGGLASYIWKVGHALSEKGHVISVIVISNENKYWKDKDIDIYEIKGANIPKSLYKIPYLNNFLPLIGQLLNAQKIGKKVWKLHKIKQFDIIQASSYLTPGFSLLKNGKIPIVNRTSSYRPLWRSANGFQRIFSEYLCDWLEIRQIIDADASYTPSKYLANEIENIEGFHSDVLPSPFDPPEITNYDESFFKKNLSNLTFLLYFGTLNRMKGVDLFAEIIPAILRTHPDIRFVFIGRDNGLPNGQKVFDFILHKCEIHKKNLIYYPPLNKKDLYPVIAHAKGVIIPSRVDNYPNVCLEAQMFRIPVIGTKNTGVDEIIIDGETGFICENSSSSSITQSIERLLQLSPDEYSQMQKKIERKSLEIKSEDRIMNLIRYYENIISKHAM